MSGWYNWGGGNLNRQDAYGLWWSTTANSSNDAYALAVGSSFLDPQNSNVKTYGFALRCVSL
ncbi:hypothetical protein IJH16_01585 [Candidatus Saccharibacteria bacterium]|nr:hypothetical protein [Candidatus Saccharibacteria bacterium]